MIEEQLRARGIDDSRVLDAMERVPRHLFVSEQMQEHAYADMALLIGEDQTISQPYIVGLMTQLLELQPEDRVLEIGTGSGYQAAVLAHLAGEVYTIERVKPLLDQAWERLMDLNLRNVHFRHGDGTLGWPEAAPFDRILITAGAPKLPKELLLEQLKDGGLAVMPVGPQDDQMLIGAIRRGSELDVADICPCRFVKLIGQRGWEQE